MRALIARIALAGGLAAIPDARAAQPPPPPGPPAEALAAPIGPPPGIAEVPAPVEAPIPGPAATAIPEDHLATAFTGPEGAVFEVQNGTSIELPLPPDGAALATALPVGMVSRVKMTNLPNRPEEEVYLNVEVVGHLHRDPEADPSRFPMRIHVSQGDMEDVLERSRLITQVIYLEDPDTAEALAALPGSTPTVEVGPSEDPYRVARKLGRIMAVVHVGARRPEPMDLGIDERSGLVGGPCPFADPIGGRCHLPCGPGCGPLMGRGGLRPKDEYLCDGGDREDPIRPGETVAKGIDPRDAVVSFLSRSDRVKRNLPTNIVCVYSPRFARVVALTGPGLASWVQIANRAEIQAAPETRGNHLNPTPLTLQEAPILNRDRTRATTFVKRVAAIESAGVAILEGLDSSLHVGSLIRIEQLQISSTKVLPEGNRTVQRAFGIKTAETVVIAGMAEGLGEITQTNGPKEFIADEPPEDRPGLAVVKQVDARVAEPGQTLTFAIRYKNIGNIPIRAVAVTDSLLPRFAYLGGTARGPRGTVFSTIENRSGGRELRWELPATLKPGEEGLVSFQAKVL